LLLDCLYYEVSVDIDASLDLPPLAAFAVLGRDPGGWRHCSTCRSGPYVALSQGAKQQPARLVGPVPIHYQITTREYFVTY
jgi:hypothetical protein